MGKKYSIDETTLSGIASAIKNKLNWPASTTIKPKSFATYIDSMPKTQTGCMSVEGNNDSTLDCTGFSHLIMKIMPFISDDSVWIGDDLRIDVTAGTSLSSTSGDKTITFTFSPQDVDNSVEWGHGIMLTFYPNGYCSTSCNGSMSDYAGTYLKSIKVEFGTYDSNSGLECDYWAFLR